MEMEMAFSVFVLFTSCSFWLCLIKMYRMCVCEGETEKEGVRVRGGVAQKTDQLGALIVLAQQNGH